MGVSGSGKSTAARAVQERLGWEFAEGDDFHPPENVEKMAAGHPLTDADRLPWLGSAGRLDPGARPRRAADDHELLGAAAALPRRAPHRRRAHLLRPPRRRQGAAARADGGARALHAALAAGVAARHARAAGATTSAGFTVDVDQPPDAIADEVLRRSTSPRRLLAHPHPATPQRLRRPRRSSHSATPTDPMPLFRPAQARARAHAYWDSHALPAPGPLPSSVVAVASRGATSARWRGWAPVRARRSESGVPRSSQP